MKRQKRGKCKLWRSFTNIFSRKRHDDSTETPQPPFAGENDNFSPPPLRTAEEKIPPSKTTETSKTGNLNTNLIAPTKQKSLPQPGEGQKSTTGDLDAVGRGNGLINTNIAKHKIQIKQPNKKPPAKYKQKQSTDSESLEDLTTVRTDGQGVSLNLKDAIGPDCAPGELSSGSDTEAPRKVAKIAVLPGKPLPKEPNKKKKDEEKTEEFKRIPSKKKTTRLSGISIEAKKLQPNLDGIEKSTNPVVVSSSISRSQNNSVERKAEAKAAIETPKAAQLSAALLRPTANANSGQMGVNDPKIRHSVSMKEVKHLAVKDESKPKASAVESSKLSSSAKERKLAGKTESLNVDGKPEAETVVISTLESKSKAAKKEAAFPSQGSLDKLSETEKAAKDARNDFGGERAESSQLDVSNSEAKRGQENSLRRSQRRDSKLKADGKRADSFLAPPADSSSRRNSSRRSSARKSGQMIEESNDKLTAKNSAQDNTDKVTENKKEIQIKVDLVDDTPIVADLLEKKGVLTGKASGEQEVAPKALDQASNVLEDPGKGSSLTEGRSLTDSQTTEPMSVADDRELSSGKGREDVREGKSEKKSNEEIKRNSSYRKPDFVSPAVPAKALQKGKDIGSGVQSDTVSAVAVTEISKLSPAADSASDEVQKRKSRMVDEDGLKEFNKVLQKVQNKPGNESTTSPREASPPATKTESKSDAVTSSATGNGNIKPPKGVPVPPKTYRNGLGGSQKTTSVDAKSTPSANLSRSISSNKNSHSRNPSITGGESKVQSESAEAEKSIGDVVGSSTSIKAKVLPPVGSRSGKVQPKAPENTKDPGVAWIGKANRMSKDFSGKLQKIETKAEEKKAEAEVITDDNFERGGGGRSSVRDMVKKLQKQNHAS